jgi:uncharacterized Zn-binding protein involved in type VI secretion
MPMAAATTAIPITIILESAPVLSPDDDEEAGASMMEVGDEDEVLEADVPLVVGFIKDVVCCPGFVVIGSFVVDVVVVVVITGGRVVISGDSVVMIGGSVVITGGSVVMIGGSVVITGGSVVITGGSVVIITGGVVVGPGVMIIELMFSIYIRGRDGMK